MNPKKLPNFFTFIRLISIPIIWFIAVNQERLIFTILFIVAGSTDILDGFFARKLKIVSRFGAKFDNITDELMAISTIFWVYFLMPEIIFENLLPLSFILFFLVIDGMVRLLTKKSLELQFNTHLSKISGFIGFLFVFHASIFGYSQIFLYVLVTASFLMAVEEIFLCLAGKKVDENTKSIFFR